MNNIELDTMMKAAELIDWNDFLPIEKVAAKVRAVGGRNPKGRMNNNQNASKATKSGLIRAEANKLYPMPDKPDYQGYFTRDMAGTAGGGAILGGLGGAAMGFMDPDTEDDTSIPGMLMGRKKPATISDRLRGGIRGLIGGAAAGAAGGAGLNALTVHSNNAGLKQNYQAAQQKAQQLRDEYVYNKTTPQPQAQPQAQPPFISLLSNLIGNGLNDFLNRRAAAANNSSSDKSPNANSDQGK